MCIDKKIKILIYFILISLSSTILADNSSEPTIATVANNILGNDRATASSLVILMMAASATFGSAFALLAILKFKQHKDNPQQTHLGQPFALFLIAVIFIWLPYYLGQTGYTLTGENSSNDRIEIFSSSNLLCPPNDSGSDSSNLGCPESGQN